MKTFAEIPDVQFDPYCIVPGQTTSGFSRANWQSERSLLAAILSSAVYDLMRVRRVKARSKANLSMAQEAENWIMNRYPSRSAYFPFWYVCEVLKFNESRLRQEIIQNPEKVYRRFMNSTKDNTFIDEQEHAA